MFRENLEVFVNESELAISANLQSGLVSKNVKVILDKDYKVFDFNAEGRNIKATIKTSEAIEVRHGDLIEIESTTYTITSTQPIDDGAFTDLILRE